MNELSARPTRDNGTQHAQLIGAWLASYGSEHTRTAYRRDVLTYLELLDGIDIDLLEAQRKHIDLYTRHRERLDAPATVARRLASISAFYRYALSEGLVKKNPAELIRRPTVEQNSSTTLALTQREAILYLEAARSQSLRTYALALLLLTTGLRISEALETREADLGLETLKIRRKGGKFALIPLSEPLRIVLRELTETTGHEIARGDEGSVPIFQTRTGRPWPRTDAARTLRMISERRKLGKKVTPHVLRHTHATLALEAGVPLHHLQDSLGHADPRTTRRYDHSRSRLENHSAKIVSRIIY